MEKKGLTFSDLEKKTGLARETIRRARNEKISDCSLKTLYKIALALGVKVQDLFVQD